MNDNKINSNENQYGANVSGPIYESVPIENSLRPEEISADVTSPEETAFSNNPPSDIPTEEPLVYEEGKGKYIAIVLIIVFFIAVFFIAFRLISGSKNGLIKKPIKEIKLTYWGLWEEKELIDPSIKQYQAKNPGIKIDYQKMPQQDYREKLIVRSKNGQGPDIFRFHNTWLVQIKDVTAALPSSVMTNAEFEKTFYPIHQKDLKLGDYYYGLPLEVDGLVLIYNDDLFKKAGLDRSPANWDELLDYASKVQVEEKTGNLITAGLAIGTASNIEHFSDIFGLLLLLNGGDINKINEQEGVEALQAYRRFAEPPNNTWNETMPNSINAFIQQKVAMIIAPSWQVMVIKSANPDLKLKVAMIPQPPRGKQISLASYWVEGVSKMSKNQIEAWKFLKYLTEKENLTTLYQLQSSVRLFGEPYSRVDLAQTLIQNEYIGPVVKQAQEDVYMSLPCSSKTYDNGLNDEIIRYLENAINSTSQGVSYGEALDTAKKGIDQVLSRFKTQ